MIIATPAVSGVSAITAAVARAWWPPSERSRSSTEIRWWIASAVHTSRWLTTEKTIAEATRIEAKAKVSRRMLGYGAGRVLDEAGRRTRRRRPGLSAFCATR